MSIIATNKRAKYDYEILETFEAGIVLSGQEVKSIKTGHIDLSGSYVTLRNKEAFLINANVPAYKFAGKLPEYDPRQPRKLLLKKQELKSLLGKIKQKGLTLVPLQIYTKHGRIKLQFGLAKGRKKIDKRELIKKREIKKRIRRLI
jgi:SsrA-binding protein